MKSFLKASFIYVMTISSLYANCGLKGSIYKRIENCKQTTTHLKLVYEKGPVQAWLNIDNSSVYLSMMNKKMTWDQAKQFCTELSSQVDLRELSINSWQVPSSKTFPEQNLAEGFFEMGSSGSDEFRFWMSERFHHPSGTIWATFYSNQGYYDKWFADAGDSLYRGICVVAVSLNH